MTEDLEQYLPHVYRFALRLTGNTHRAEDLCHDTFVRALRARHQLIDPTAARPWLLRITANLWKDQQRRPQSAVDGDVTELVAGEASSPRQQIEIQETQDNILRHIQQLPERQRAILHLYAIEDMTIPQIADTLELTCQNVRVHLHRARQTMKTKLPDLQPGTTEK